MMSCRFEESGLRTGQPCEQLKTTMLLRKGSNRGRLEIQTVASLGVVIWPTRQHSAFQGQRTPDGTVSIWHGLIPVWNRKK